MTTAPVRVAAMSLSIFLALAGGNISCVGTQGDVTLTLAREGKTEYVIITAKDPTPAARLAALELQSHVMRISGAELPIVTDGEEVQGRGRILVGESSATRELGLRGSDFAPQEYLIAFRDKTLILMGRDWLDTEANRKEQGRTTASSEPLKRLRHRVNYWYCAGYPQRSVGKIELPGLFDDQGTCYATYDFLERFCGVRWYGPSQVNVVIPRKSVLSVGGEDIRRSPALKHRSAQAKGRWPFMRGQWGECQLQEIRLYWRRLRLGGERWAGNHTFHRETIKKVLNDSAYQAHNPKGKGSQLCYTSRKLVGRVAQMARDYFDGKGKLPHGWRAMGDYFAIVPDDNRNFCRCPACTKLLDRGRGRGTKYFSGGQTSDYWFSFVNAVAREVGATHPNKYIATLAYWDYAFPPKGMTMEPNVSIAPCLHLCFYAISDAMRDNDMAFYDAWRERTKAPMFLWVYYHHPMEVALAQKWKCFPNFMPHESARWMRKFIRDGVRGMFRCGEPDQLEHYVMAKVWDDPSLDTDAVMNEFFDLYFGAAAEPMRKFYARIEKIVTSKASYPPGKCWWTQKISWRSLGNAERMDELGKLIAEAERLAATDIEKRRVGLWREAVWKWMQDGRAQYLSRKRKK